MNRLIIQIILVFLFISSFAQTDIDNKELKSICNHAIDNINVFEKVLNLLAASNNPEEKKMIISNCKETIFDKSSKIEDDLNPKNIDLKISNFIEIDSYLELFPLILSLEDNSSAVKFSNIYVSDVHTIDYKYIRVYFDCFFNGTHKTLNEKFKIVPRVATIRVYQKQNGISTRIVSIKFANPDEYASIKRESDVWIEKSNYPQTEIKHPEPKKDELSQEVKSEVYFNQNRKKGYKYYLRLANIHYSRNQVSEAYPYLIKALESKPNDKYASDLLFSIRSYMSEQKFEVDLIKKGESLLANKEYSKAYSFFKIAYRLNRNNKSTAENLNKLYKNLDPIYDEP